MLSTPGCLQETKERRPTQRPKDKHRPATPVDWTRAQGHNVPCFEKTKTDKQGDTTKRLIVVIYL